MLHGHGNDKYRYAGEIKVDFSSNVWYKPLPEWFYQKLSETFKNIIDYPHPKAFDLVKELSLSHNIPEDNIWATNGSVEGIYLLAQAFEKKKSAIIYPCFSEYGDACRRYKHDLSFYSNKEDWQKRQFSEDLIWFGNPNNPDGKNISVKEIENLLSLNPTSIFVIDEAFSELCINFESALLLIQKYQNLVILRSFTKSFAIPGIRLGYVVARQWIIEKLNNLSIPWTVNSLAIEAGKIILQNYAELIPNRNEHRKLNILLQNKLSGLPELNVIPSDCNYFLVQLEKGNATELKKYLVQQHGILIRDASNFRGLNNRYIRFSVQTEENIELLVSALKSFFNESL